MKPERYIVSQADAYLPAPVLRLIRALRDLRDEAYPPATSGPVEVGGRTVPASRPPGPEGFSPDHWERLLKRHLASVERLTEKVVLDIRGVKERPRGWKCPKCKRHQRLTARFCDRCCPQVERPTDPRS